MATQPQTGLTYEDLRRFPEDNLRRELIGGELIVTAAPSTRHQDVVVTLVGLLLTYSQRHGGKVYPAPTDVYFSDRDVVEPDVVFVRADHVDRVEQRFIRSAPDVVVEVSSPSTRALELRRKKDLYEENSVPEYWYVDLEADRLEVYRLESGRYPAPLVLRRGESFESVALPQLTVLVDDLLGRLED